MKLKNKTRLLNELAKESDTPIDFIDYVRALQQQSVNDFVEIAGISEAHYYVLRNQIKHGQSIGIKTCVKLSKGLDIDPVILNRIIADYNLNMYIKKGEYGTDTDN